MIGDISGEFKIRLQKLHKLGWQILPKDRGERLAAVGGAVAAQGVEQFAIGDQVDANSVALLPVAGDLQDRGAREAAVGKEHRLVKVGTLCGGTHGCGDTGQRFEFLVRERQRHEAGAGRDHIEAKLRGNLIGKAGRTHFGNGFAATGDHEVARAHAAVAAVLLQGHLEGAAIMRDVADAGLQPKLRACLVHLRPQHRDDVFRRIVAKQLAQRFFVPRDAVV